MPAGLAAQALGLSVEELLEHEGSARAKATELTLAFHEEMICEPAALAEADSPEARLEAVTAHVAGCRACRAEFGARVKQVLRSAGELGESVPRLTLR